jgi:hypothetical protein
MQNDDMDAIFATVAVSYSSSNWGGVARISLGILLEIDLFNSAQVERVASPVHDFGPG